MDNLKKVFMDLTNSLNKANKEAAKFKDAIEKLQEVCEHDWEQTGRDSHKNHYTCLICGKREEW